MDHDENISPANYNYNMIKCRAHNQVCVAPQRLATNLNHQILDQLWAKTLPAAEFGY
jgi:hypothetical protein